jgi:molybdate transport system permease protein
VEFTESDLSAIWLTIQLAGTVTALLLLIGTPLAWWLARTSSILRAPIGALTTLPLVLPPTVLGFYLLIALGPQSPINEMLDSLGISPLPFSFSGLVIASMIYSLPFVVQPIQNAFANLDEQSLEAASTLGAGPLDRFIHVVLPLSKSGFLAAIILGFAHTVGEFGIVLMIGGNIPGETQVVSTQIYTYVESLNYESANKLSAVMLLFSLLILIPLYLTQNKNEGNLLKISPNLPQ